MSGNGGRERALCITLMALAVGASGCELIGGFEDFEAASSTSSGGSSQGGASTGGRPSTGGAPTCPNGGATPGTAGPEMVQRQRPDGSCYFIDATEVTRAQYAAFLETDPRPAVQSSYCSGFNDDFTTTSCETAASVTISDDDDHPIVCVDFCDAEAFCVWAGKRLCAGEKSRATDPDISEWYGACAGSNDHAYPYGNEFSADACNGFARPDTGCDSGDCVTVAVNALLTCDTADGVSDLSGNVAEWVDECNARSGASDQCNVRGGSMRDPAARSECGTVTSLDRDFADAFTGFRCCAD